jgi:hypothetical protein
MTRASMTRFFAPAIIRARLCHAVTLLHIFIGSGSIAYHAQG